ncbi:hypothetical protein PoB_003219300 [Plakobranchus ocellatus]|uniref:Uncharacterized protein n=1 Tax=Plakobranchus ocellatus TaxID=259542 RepID=A0AAV4AFY0_9GAST|nr:hypothetical protein PoB_003219300 [Plakobranchus ocellatus]
MFPSQMRSQAMRDVFCFSTMASYSKWIIVVFALAIDFPSPSYCQVHWTPTQASYDVIECYNCSPYHKGFEFPQCLYVVDTCNPGQKCSIMYKPDQGFGLGPVIGCSDHCYQVRETPRLCAYGGGILPNMECYACCEANNTCVTHLTTQLSRDYFLSPKVFCPGRCHRSDLRECMAKGIECIPTEFCVMSYDSNAGIVEGWCREANPHAEAACQAQMQIACTYSPKDLNKDVTLNQSSCLWGCLKNNVDVMKLFNHYPIHDFMTTAASP